MDCERPGQTSLVHRKKHLQQGIKGSKEEVGEGNSSAATSGHSLLGSLHGPWGPHHVLRGITLFFPVTPPSPAHTSLLACSPLISLDVLSPIHSSKAFLLCPPASGERVDSNTWSTSCEESRPGRGAKPPLVPSHLS